MLGRFELRIINPQLLPITHRDAGSVPFDFTAKFIWRLEPNLAAARNRLVQQMNFSFFLEIGLQIRRRHPSIPDPAEQVLNVCW